MKRLLTILIVITLFYGIGRAQQFPVQVTPQLLPPYSVQVSDYYSPGAAGTKLNLLLLLRDFNKPQLQVRLRMSIEGQSVSLRTREDAVFTPITIESGTPTYVDPSELAQYFNPDNLDFSGITRQQYMQTGKLPEGFYTFCFEAIEISTNQSVSNKGCTFAWMTLNEPPILNLPRKAEGVIPADPQNIIFQWTPRHTASPTAAFVTDYIFSIVEMNDDAIAPEAAFFSNAPLHVDSVTTTTYLYDATKPALIAGKKYAWRVQAKAKNGIQDLATFRNQGYSETFWFTYQNNCAVPTGVAASPQGQRVGIEWQQNPVHLEYKVEYREANNADAVWFEIGNTLPRVSITDLKPNTIYQYRVGGACEYGRYTFGNLLQFTTNGENATTVPECGIDPNLTDPPQTLLQTFPVGDTIFAGDYDVIVTSITGQTSFSGEGYVKMSWLGGTNVAVRFTNIGINTDKKLAIGEIETTYDPTEGGIADIDEYIDVFVAGYGVGGVVSGEVTADTTFNFIIQMPDGIDIQVPTGYDNATGKGDGPITITVTPQGGGNPISYTVDQLPTTLQDKDGNIYQVNKDQQVISLGSKGGEQWVKSTNIKHINTDKAVVKFVKYDDPKVQYAFDEWNAVYKRSGTFNKEYERLNEDYYVSAKAIAPGKTDYLKAVVTIIDNSIIADSIKYVNGKGTVYAKTKLQDGSYEIAIVGGPEKDAQEIYALYPQAGGKTLNLGKVLVASYPFKEFNVKIIPQANIQFDIPSIQDSIQAIYKRYNVKINVSVGSNLPNNSWDTGDGALDVGSTGILSSYTDEMKRVIELFKQSATVDNKTVYLFYLERPSISGRLGDMSFGKQYGFIFKSNSTNELVWSVAHELGHGLFKLKHSFDYSGLNKNDLSDNLMDYAGGRELAKAQWDLLHDQGLLTGLFAKDEASQATVVSIDILNKPEFINTDPFPHFTFISPAYKPISIPTDSLTQIVFSTCDNLVKNNDGSFAGYVPIGTLLGFTYGGNYYNFKGSSNSVLTFDYYYNKENNIVYYDKVLKHKAIANQTVTNYGGNCITSLAYWDGEANAPKLSFYRFNSGYSLTTEENAALAKYTGGGNLGAIENIVGTNTLFWNNQPIGNYTSFENGLTTNSTISLSERSKDFCISLADYAKKGMKTAPLVIAHAQKITDYPESDICLQRDEADKFLDGLYYESDFPLIKNIPPPSVSEANNLYDQARVELNYRRVAANTLSSYPVISDGVDAVRVALKDNKDGDYLATVFADISVCGVSQLSGVEIVQALRELIPVSNDGKAREAILKLLNAAIHTGQQEKIMALFEGEQKMQFEKLFTTFKENSNKDFGELVYLTYSIYKVVYPDNGYAYPYALSGNDSRLFPMGFKQDLTYSDFGSVTTNQYANGGDFHAIIYKLTKSRSDFSAIVYNFFDEVILDFYTEGIEPIFISNDFKNKRVSVPGFFVAYLIHEYKRGEDMRFVRKLIDAGVIVATTIASGGAGSVLGLIDISVAGTDIIVQNNYDALNNSSNLSAFYSAFDGVYSAYAMVRVIQSMPEIVKFSEELGSVIVMNGITYGKRILINFEQLIAKFQSLSTIEQQTVLKALRLNRDLILRFTYFAKQSTAEASFATRLLRNVEGKLVERSFEAVAGRNVTVKFIKEEGLVAEEGAVRSVIGDIALDSKGGYIVDGVGYETGTLEYVGKLKTVRHKVNGQAIESDINIYKNGSTFVSSAGKYVANTGAELRAHLNAITSLPVGKSHNGKMYKFVNGTHDAKEINPYMNEATNRFRKGLYLSETKPGNTIEANAYGGTGDKNLYEFTDIQVSNLLDLTDLSTIQKLGTTFEQMKLRNVANAYEYTQEVAIWAKNKGYSGIKFYGAHGSTDYINFVIFEQSTVNSAIKGAVDPISW